MKQRVCEDFLIFPQGINKFSTYNNLILMALLMGFPQILPALLYYYIYKNSPKNVKLHADLPRKNTSLLTLDFTHRHGMKPESFFVFR
jgi:hypothetical protein